MESYNFFIFIKLILVLCLSRLNVGEWEMKNLPADRENQYFEILACLNFKIRIGNRYL